MYTVPVGQNPTGAVSRPTPSACIRLIDRLADDGSQQEERDLQYLRRVWYDTPLGWHGSMNHFLTCL